MEQAWILGEEPIPGQPLVPNSVLIQCAPLPPLCMWLCSSAVHATQVCVNRCSACIKRRAVAPSCDQALVAPHAAH